MALLNNTQPSFSSGILSTELFSRIDYNKLEAGLRQCENWVIRPAGGAVYRAGTEYIAEVKDSTTKPILVPFSLKQGDGYCLEFGNQYIRFYKGNQQIIKNNAVYEISTTYTTSELNELKYVQYKNQLFIVHKNHAPAVLTMNSETSWTLTTMSLNPTVAQVTNLSIVADTPKQSSTVVNFSWQYAVSVVDENDNEGFALKSSTITSDVDLLNQPITVSFNAPAGAKTGYKFNIYRIFRGQFFWVYGLDYVSGTSSYSVKDTSFQADTTKSIKIRFNAFDSSNYPSAVGLWNQRLIFGNTPKGPNTLYGSRVGVFDDFTTTLANNADESFELELNASDNDYITDIIPLDDLIVMTQSRIWRVTGNSPLNMNAYIESYSGSSGLRPYAYKKSILYIDASLNTVSNFIYSYELNGYTGQNLDILCRDMFDGYTLEDITFINSPFGILYVVRNDGVLLGLTYLKEENVYAWHKHTTNGLFERVCSLDNAKNDDVYVIVNRDGHRFVERFRYYIDEKQGPEDSWHLDCATKYISNWSIYQHTSSTTITTNYSGYTCNYSQQWVCWRLERRVKSISDTYIWLPQDTYYYNKSGDGTLTSSNSYASPNKKTVNNVESLSKVELNPAPQASTYRYVRYSAGDFTDSYNGNIWLTNTIPGSEVYNKVGNSWEVIGTLSSVSGTTAIFNNRSYTRNSTLDVTDTSTVETTTSRYVEGVPTQGGYAYDTPNKETFYVIDAVGTGTITIDNVVYTFKEGSASAISEVTGLSRFNGKRVTALCDGSEYKDLLVENGTVTLPKEFSLVLVGYPYTGIIEPVPVDHKRSDGSSTVGYNRRICKANIRYYRSRGLWYGVSLDHLYQIKTYTQYNLGEEIPLETLNLNLEVPDTYKTESAFFVVQKSPLPALLQSITLEIEYGEKN